MDQYAKKLIQGLESRSEVEAILLAGSHGSGRADEKSDYDFYVYLNQSLSPAVRKEITQECCDFMEIDNQFWETEDDGVLKSGTEVELIYRDLNWLEEVVSSKVEKFQADMGYTTCFWFNLKHSKILFDRNGKAKALKNRFDVEYPDQLAQNIIKKNLPILEDVLPSYKNQVKKALDRGDRISVNHRIAEYLASYFDILFALNRYPHPGEKQLAKWAQELPIRPLDQNENLNKLMDEISLAGPNILATMNELTKNLKVVTQE